MIACTHKTPRSHQFGLGENARPRWRCSFCPAVDVWRPGWGYWGSYECPKCWEASIDDVHCPNCVAAFTKKHGRSSERQGTEESK